MGTLQKVWVNYLHRPLRIFGTVFYQLMAVATITFSKTNFAATKQGWLLNLCGEPELWHLCSTYVAKVQV